MNTLKNILFFGLLLAVLCGVYLSLNRSPEAAPLPKGLTDTTTPPTVDIGVPELTPSSSAPPAMGGPPNLPPLPPTLNAPPTGGDPGMAPPYRQQPPTDANTTAKPWPSHGGSDALPPPPGSAVVKGGPDYPIGVNKPPDQENTTGFSRPNNSSPQNSLLPLAHSSTNLERVMEQVKLQVGLNKFAEALLNLSQLYGNPDLPAAQARQVTQILDQMAAKVIYSREHLLESAYLVQAGDTLDIIADRYKVPALLLARINGIHDPQNLPPGRELKVLKGPFWAQISTDRSEMTLMLDGRYAGRFNVVLSGDLSHAESLWTVREKSPQASAADGRPNRQWMELSSPSGQICSLRGTNDTRGTAGSDNHSTIWLSEQDMDDVFGILSQGSRVIIQR